MKQKIAKICGYLFGTIILVLAVVIATAHFKFTTNANAQFSAPTMNISDDVKSANIELGKRIVTVRNGCNDCHGANLAGRLFIDDPAIGKMYSANLTPAGLKNATDEEIARAIRFGIGRDKRSLVFMPSFEYEALSKEDIAAVIAYLRSVPAVESQNARPAPGPMAKILSMLGKMPLLLPAYASKLNLDFNSKPPEGPTLEFGRYLANSSCVGCHGREFKGGPIAGAPPDWLPAASLRLAGNSEWSEETFTRALREGFSPTRKSGVRFPMPIALTKQMSDDEIKALWSYFSSLEN